MDQSFKTRIRAQRIEKGMYLERLQNVGVLLIRSLQPHKGLLPIVESEIRIYESRGRNIAFPLPLF